MEHSEGTETRLILKINFLTNSMKIRFRVPDPSLNNYDIRRSSSYMSEKKLIYLLSDAIPKITQIDHQNNYGAKTP